MVHRVLHYSHNERIIKSGDLQRRMYIILEGNVEITLSDGNQKITVAKLKKGDFFGEMSLFTNKPRSANAYAIGEVKLTYIDGAHQLQAFLLRNPKFAAKMVNILSERLAKTDELLLNEVNEVNRLKVLHKI